MNGKITHYLAFPLSVEYVPMFGLEVGDSDGQQLWEALAILLAVDIRTAIWSQHRIILGVKSDKVGAFTLLAKMRPSGPTIGTIAHELALHLAQPPFPPDATQTPGVADVIADKLSRVYSTDGTGSVDRSLHLALAEAEETATPLRDANWYKAYDRQPATSVAKRKWWGYRK